MKPVTRKRLNVNFKKGTGIKTTCVHYCISASDANPVLHQSEQGNERGTDISESDLDAELQDSGVIQIKMYTHNLVMSGEKRN